MTETPQPPPTAIRMGRSFAFPPELRAKALSLVDEGLMTHREIADKLKVSKNTIDKWVGARNKDRGVKMRPGRRAKPAPTSEVSSLRQRIIDLEFENQELRAAVIEMVLTKRKK